MTEINKKEVRKITFKFVVMVVLFILAISTILYFTWKDVDKRNKYQPVLQIINSASSHLVIAFTNNNPIKAGLFGSDYTRYFNYNYKAITTSAWDTTFTDSWEMVTVYSDTLDCKVRIGAPDTDSWSSRSWIYLTAGMTLTLGPKPDLTKIEVKSVGGACGFYMLGYRKDAQTF